MNVETQLKRYLDQKVPIASYKVIEQNASETYMKISIVSNNLTTSSKVIYQGVALVDIDTIDTTIDDSKTIIIRY